MHMDMLLYQKAQLGQSTLTKPRMEKLERKFGVRLEKTMLLAHSLKHHLGPHSYGYFARPEGVVQRSESVTEGTSEGAKTEVWRTYSRSHVYDLPADEESRASFIWIFCKTRRHCLEPRKG